MPGTGASVTSIKCRWENGVQLFYDPYLMETVHAMAPVWWKDDFIGHQIGVGSLGNTADTWEVVDVNDASEALLADTATGIFTLNLAATDEAEDAVLYFGDQTVLNALDDLNFECKLAVHTTPGTGVAAVWGLAGDHNLDKDTIAVNAWFRLQAGLDLLVETDDVTTNDDDNDTTINLVEDAFHVYRIDMSDLSDVKFYVDGVRQLGTSAFDMSALTGATGTTGLMQPYFSLDKASGTGLGSLYIDYVAFWGRRTSYVDNS